MSSNTDGHLRGLLWTLLSSQNLFEIVFSLPADTLILPRLLQRGEFFSLHSWKAIPSTGSAAISGDENTPRGSQQPWLLQSWCFSGGLCGLITQLRGFWSCISMAHRALLCPQLRSVQLPAFSPSTPQCLFSTKLSNPIKDGTQSKPLASKGDAPGWGWGDPHCLGLSLLPWAVQWYSWRSCLEGPQLPFISHAATRT